MSTNERIDVVGRNGPRECIDGRAAVRGDISCFTRPTSTRALAAADFVLVQIRVGRAKPPGYADEDRSGGLACWLNRPGDDRRRAFCGKGDAPTVPLRAAPKRRRRARVRGFATTAWIVAVTKHPVGQRHAGPLIDDRATGAVLACCNAFAIRFFQGQLRRNPARLVRAGRRGPSSDQVGSQTPPHPGGAGRVLLGRPRRFLPRLIRNPRRRCSPGAQTGHERRA